MPKKVITIPDEKLALYDKLLAEFPEVERKGASMPYTSINGNMYSFLNDDGELALRLPAREREVFISKYKSKLFESQGAIMKEYVKVPDNLLKDTKRLKSYFEFSLSYAKSLKSKKK